MCNHHNKRFKDKFPIAMSRILASHGIHDPHTVSIMIDSCIPFLVDPQITCNIERDWCFAKNDAAQEFGIWMSRNSTGSILYCDLTGSYTGADGVVNEVNPFYFEYNDLTVDDRYMVDTTALTKLFQW